MQIQVEYVAQVRTAAGVSAEELAIDDGGTVADLVEQACRQHAGLARVLCDAAGALHASILVFRGEDPCDPGTALNDGDSITFLSPISGG